MAKKKKSKKPSDVLLCRHCKRPVLHTSVLASASEGWYHIIDGRISIACSIATPRKKDLKSLREAATAS